MLPFIEALQTITAPVLTRRPKKQDRRDPDKTHTNPGPGPPCHILEDRRTSRKDNIPRTDSTSNSALVRRNLDDCDKGDPGRGSRSVCDRRNCEQNFRHEHRESRPIKIPMKMKRSERQTRHANRNAQHRRRALVPTRAAPSEESPTSLCTTSAACLHYSANPDGGPQRETRCHAPRRRATRHF